MFKSPDYLLAMTSTIQQSFDDALLGIFLSNHMRYFQLHPVDFIRLIQRTNYANRPKKLLNDVGCELHGSFDLQNRDVNLMLRQTSSFSDRIFSHEESNKCRAFVWGSWTLGRYECVVAYAQLELSSFSRTLDSI